MILAVVGQTASGKSDLAIDLAQYLGTSLLSVDAMQLYRGLDVGTAKTPVDQRRGVEHLQIDKLTVAQEASVAKYQEQARQDIARHEGNVVAAGGSALYLRALLDEIDFPGTDLALRQKWQLLLEEKGSVSLHEQLQQWDPVAAQQIHPNNGRRIVRALEVIELTGRPFSASLPQYLYHDPHTIQMALRWPIEQLDARIDLRTEKMFQQGIVEETEAVLAEYGAFGKTAARATGYAEALAVLDGTMTTSEAIQSVALATRQLARRQLKWFKRDPRIHWLDPQSKESLHDQALRVLERSLNVG